MRESDKKKERERKKGGKRFIDIEGQKKGGNKEFQIILNK